MSAVLKAIPQPPKKHIMLDLETMGNSSNALILSIGACKFYPLGAGIEDKFYVRIDPESARGVGGEIDLSTVMWWMEQSDAARKELVRKEGRVRIHQALMDFNQWVTEDTPVWGNGATFDNVIIRNAMTRCSIEPVWKFWNDRCYRTLKGLCPSVKMERSGTAHNALDDAISQAKHMQAICRMMRPEGV